MNWLTKLFERLFVRKYNIDIYGRCKRAESE